MEREYWEDHLVRSDNEFFKSVIQVAVREGVVGIAKVEEYVQKSAMSECSKGGMLMQTMGPNDGASERLGS